jgi:hypothetical protein
LVAELPVTIQSKTGQTIMFVAICLVTVAMALAFTLVFHLVDPRPLQ